MHRLKLQIELVVILYNLKLPSTNHHQNVQDFVIQEEVLPTLDDTKRKFVLRAHVLIYHSGRSQPEFALHQDVICLSHATPYESNPKACKSSHISQYGKKHPKPMLLSK